jgi:ATP-dependent helicase/nuclease subunit B
VGTRAVDALFYLKLSGGAEPGKAQPVEDVAALTERAIAQLTARITWFDEESTAYRSRVQPYSADSVGDYDHLARVREWSASGWSETP